MRYLLYSVVVAAVGVLSFCNSSALAADDDPVQVQFAQGDTAVDTLATGVQLFNNQDEAADKIPAELADLSFTKRGWKAGADVTIDAPAGTTVYVAVGSGNMARQSRKFLTSANWVRIQDLDMKGDESGPLTVYKHAFTDSQHIVIPSSRGSLGIIVIARQLSLSNPQKSDDKPDNEKPQDETTNGSLPSNVALHNTDDDLPTTRISKLQATIKFLYVYPQKNGDALGGGSDLILTTTPGLPKDDTIPVKFTSAVGRQMLMVLDDVTRAINTRYPRIEARKLEFSFEDKFQPYDGPSIGAALGTLMLSVIENFDVDPHFALTGDVSAEGKVRIIGGVGAKLRGAKDVGCTIVAIPNEDLEELIDAVIFNGVSEITDIQVIGISTLDDAVAIACADRDSDEQEAIKLFAEIQQSMQASPGYLRTDEAQNKLKRVTELAPNHLSANLLLRIAQHKERRRLTPAASEYYANMELKSVIPVLSDQDVATGKQHLMPAAVAQGLKLLSRLRPISDVQIQPFVDSCVGLIEAYSEYDTGAVSHKTLMEKYRLYSDEYDKLQGDRALQEKMLQEGI